MDAKEFVITNILTLLQGFKKEEIDQIHDAIVISLNDYNLTKKCTVVIPVSNDCESHLKRFIATKRIEGSSYNTLKRYYEINLRLIKFLNKPVNQISTYDIRYYLSSLRRVKNTKNSTLNGMRRCYSSFFTWLFNEGIIQHNPCSGLKQIKYKKAIKKPFTSIEIEKLKAACKTDRDLALLNFMYATGCRVSEVVRLDISDIDFESQEIQVLGKGNKERIVYLSDIAMMHLQEYLNHRTDYSDALFVGKGNKRLHKNGIYAALKRIGKSASVKDVYPHKFRRTIATDLLNRGMPIQNVATILGHEDLKTTQIYCSLNQTQVKHTYLKYTA